MIRRAVETDVEAIIEIWLHGSRLAHGFIPYDFWISRVADMKAIYLPSSETYVSEVGKKLCGFVSLVDDHLAALFVHPSFQSHGHGRQLMAFAQSKRDSLSLCVYSQNLRAVKFYEASGFRVLEERQEIHARQPELVMEWKAD